MDDLWKTEPNEKPKGPLRPMLEVVGWRAVPGDRVFLGGALRTRAGRPVEL